MVDMSDMQVVREAATLRLRVEEKLREAIASGRFRPGTRLIERELCTLLGVGRTSVREALRQLEAEGLIVTVPHRGPTVASITVEEARQLYEVRAALEGFAGRGCAEHATPEQVTRLARAVDAVEVAARKGRGLVESKTAFYDALLEACGNGVVRQLLRVIHNRVTLLRATSMAQAGRLPESLAELRAIQQRIAARDPAGAEAACVKHIRNAARVALEVLAKGSPASEAATPPRKRR
ncbi:MAG: GntR family transcriptional regulator [Deltaproteobacteria bacterium]|nr:GntR family transcriptional regulator [Deltaproteobacteria bacterium]